MSAGSITGTSAGSCLASVPEALLIPLLVGLLFAFAIKIWDTPTPVGPHQGQTAPSEVPAGPVWSLPRAAARAASDPTAAAMSSRRPPSR